MKPVPLSGFRDFLPGEAMARQRMLDRVRHVFERFGFAPIETPAVERLTTLRGTSGEEGDSLIFQILKRGGDLQRALTEYGSDGMTEHLSETGLRFDLTVPLARLVAQYSEEIPLPFMRYHIASVWRAEAAQKGRFREFGQCDVDIVGSSSMVADASVIQLIEATMLALGIDRFAVRVNNRKILNAMLNSVNIPDTLHIAALRSLDKMEKIGRQNVLVEMEQCGVPLQSANELLLLTDKARDGGLGALALLEDRAGVDELTQTLGLVGHLVTNPERIAFDPAVARGLAYYTGNVYETTLLDAPEVGSVMSGGRYDKLVGMFLGRDVPAVGVSLGIDRLFAAAEGLGLTQTGAKTPATYMVAALSDAQVPYAANVANALRDAGFSVYLFPGAGDIRKQLKHAGALAIPQVVIVGEDEAATNAVTVKDISTRQQVRVTLAELLRS